MKKRGYSQKDIQEVLDSDQEINISLMNDFKQNFKFCPVYFFDGIQYDDVLKKNWEAVPFYDYEHLTQAKVLGITPQNYYIAEIAYPPLVPYDTLNNKIKTPYYTSLSSNDQSYTNSRDYGIVLYDDNNELLLRPLTYNNISLQRKGNYFKKGGMQYVFSGSDRFQKKLEKYFKKIEQKD
ncbi:MAG: hypothetical protein R2831_10280 [Chitinophagaceae bacterium]